MDTNVAIAVLNGRPPEVRQALDAARLAGADICMSMIVMHELLYGAAASARREDNERKIALFVAAAGILLLPFDTADAREAADIRAYLKRMAKPIGPYDALIAGQARRVGAILVTANTREFDRIPGLQIVDWALPHA